MLTHNFRKAIRVIQRRMNEQIKSNRTATAAQRRKVVRRFGAAARNFARLGLLNAEDCEAAAMASKTLDGVRVLQVRALRRYMRMRRDELGFAADMETIFGGSSLERYDAAVLSRVE